MITVPVPMMVVMQDMVAGIRRLTVTIMMHALKTLVSTLLDVNTNK
jgi:hypothetical protein